jgi:hypothetical protein
VKGAQADTSTVNELHNRLSALLIEAEAKGVVLEVRIVPRLPLAMSHFTMVADARPAWRNA